MGDSSAANRTSGSPGWDPKTQTLAVETDHDTNDPVWYSNRAAVSVGQSDGDGNPIQTRQITNVAAGTNDSDAVNVAQLKRVVARVEPHYYSWNDKDVHKSNYNNNGATGTDSLAAGIGVSASGAGSVAIGTHAVDSEGNPDIIEYETETVDNGNGGTTTQIKTDANGNRIPKYRTEATGKNAVAVGVNDQADGESSVAIGYKNSAASKESVSMGAKNTIAINSYNSTALGNKNTVKEYAHEATAVGSENVVSGSNSAAVGYQNMTNTYGTALGYQNNADSSATAVGYNNQAYSSYANAFGYKNKARQFGTSIGALNDVNGYSVAVGYNNIISTGYGYNMNYPSGAFGYQNTVYDAYSTAVGYHNVIESSFSFSLGAETFTNVTDSVALGHYSIAQRLPATNQNGSRFVGYDITGENHNSDTTGVWKSTKSAVSIGNVEYNEKGEPLYFQYDYNYKSLSGSVDGTPVTRQITGVAAGTYDTDAVNVAQLKKVASTASLHYYSVKDSTDSNGNHPGNYNNEGATGENAMAAGAEDTASGKQSVAVGYNNHVVGRGSVAFGKGNKIAEGQSDTLYDSVAVGINNTASQGTYNATVLGIGNTSWAGAHDSVVVGTNNLARGNAAFSVAMGYGNKVEDGSDHSTAIGVNNKTGGNGKYSAAIGVGNNADNGSNFSAALGTYVRASDENAVAVGSSIMKTVTEKDSDGKEVQKFVVDKETIASTPRSLALGAGTKASIPDAVAIGSLSATTVGDGNVGYDITGSSHGDDKTGVWKATKAAVSIGDISYNKDGKIQYKDTDGNDVTADSDKKVIPVTRQITGLAAGTNDTDAVNVAQLKTMIAPVHIYNGGKIFSNSYEGGTEVTQNMNNTNIRIAFGKGLMAQYSTDSGNNELIQVGLNEDYIKNDPNLKGQDGTSGAAGPEGAPGKDGKDGENGKNATATVVDNGDGTTTIETKYYDDTQNKWITNAVTINNNNSGGGTSGPFGLADEKTGTVTQNLGTNIQVIGDGRRKQENGELTITDSNITTSVVDLTYGQKAENQKAVRIALSDNVNVGGNDGKDGHIGVNGKDGRNGTNGKDAVSINAIGKDGEKGADGQIGVNGKDGTSIIIGKDAVPGENGKDGLNGISVKGDPGKDGQSGVTIVGPQGENGRDGLSGIDGKVGISGKDGKDAVSISGKDGVGHIGLTGEPGKDGKSGAVVDISVASGQNGVDGTNGANGEKGKNGMDRIVYTDHNGTPQEVATTRDGLNFTGNNSDTVNHNKLNTTVNVVGEGTGKDLSKFQSASGNIAVEANGKNDNDSTLTIKLNKDLTNLNSVTTNNAYIGGNTTINNNGITTNQVVVGNTKVTQNSITVKNGTNVDMGDNQIHHVKAGTEPTDAVNVSQLGESNTNINNRISELGDNINRVGAGAAALAGLHPLDFDPDEKLDFAAGYGHYRNANAAAIGAYYRPNEDTMFSLGATVGNGDTMVNAGISWKFGQHNHVSVSRVAMAKEIIELRKELENVKSYLADQATGQRLDLSKIQLFPDTPENHWAYDYVATMAGNGVLEGYPDGYFKGNRNMTRYEMAAVLYRMMQNGAKLSERALTEFAPELDRIRVDTITKDSRGIPHIQRVRTVKGRE